MNRITLALSSPVFWTVAVMVAVAVLPVIKNLMSPTVFALVEAILGVLANYFHVNPSPTFTAKLNSLQ